MVLQWRGVLLVLAAVLAVPEAGAAGSAAVHDVVNAGRAETNYMLHCRGCHGPDGTGVNSRVPRMKNYVARFLGVAGGREYLLRVPGAANAPLSDASLAELMNWILVTQDRQNLPHDFKPYTAAEVGYWRKQSFVEVKHERQVLVDRVDTQPQ